MASCFKVQPKKIFSSRPCLPSRAVSIAPLRSIPTRPGFGPWPRDFGLWTLDLRVHRLSSAFGFPLPLTFLVRFSPCHGNPSVNPSPEPRHPQSSPVNRSPSFRYSSVLQPLPASCNMHSPWPFICGTNDRHIRNTLVRLVSSTFRRSLLRLFHQGGADGALLTHMNPAVHGFESHLGSAVAKPGVQLPRSVPGPVHG